jgi:hypothetical protein
MLKMKAIQMDLFYLGDRVNIIYKNIKLVGSLTANSIIEADDTEFTIKIYEKSVLKGDLVFTTKANFCKIYLHLLAARYQLTLPKEKRCIIKDVEKYIFDWFQVANITRSTKVDFLPKHAMKLIIVYMFK